MKFTVKTELNNITQLKDGSFDYNQEIVSMRWTALEKAKEARKQHDRINEYIRTGKKEVMKKPPSKNIIVGDGSNYSITDIKEQLKNYPTPVSDSDEQFNFLLEERDRLQKEMPVAKFLDPDIGPDQLKDEKEVFNPDGTSSKWYY